MLLPSDSTLSSNGGDGTHMLNVHSRHGSSQSLHTKPPPPRILSAQDPGRYALIVLTLINLLNYVDRYIGSATKQYYQGDLHLSDTETAIPLTAFVFVYMLCSPVFSWLADLGYKRSRIIAAGVLIWSIATAAGALAVDFWTLLISRSLVGVGEAAYATIAPALLSDYYPASRRNAVLSFFYLAIPVGAAVGYALGGEVGKYLGWRYAFLISGAPGLLVAALCLLIDEPVLGAADDLPETEVDGEADEAAAERHPRSASVSRSRSVSSSNRASSYSRSQHLHPDSDGELAEGEAAIAPVEGGAVGVGYTPPRDRSRSNTATNPSNILVRSRAPTSADEAGQPQQGGSLRPGHLVAPPWKESIISLLNNPTYLYATGGMTFVIFASGGLADWMPSWMSRVHNIDSDLAATSVGAITCIAGILGTMWGSWVGEYAKGKLYQPYLGVAGINMIITTACSWVIMLIAEDIYLIGGLVFLAQVTMWSYTGPLTALTINCVAPNMRVRAFAFQILLTHALGDAISPTIVGAISQATNSIRTAMLIIPVTFTFGCITWLVGWRRLAGEEEFDGYVAEKTNLGPGVDDSLRDPLIHDESLQEGDPTPIRMKHMQQHVQHRQEVM